MWHVHYKDGKFNIWSTVVDAYILAAWVDEEAIYQVFVAREVERAKEIARVNIERAKKEGCSAMYVAKHDRDEL